MDRKTLRKYTAPAVAAGMAPGGPPMDEADWRRLATEWFPQLTDHRLRQVSWPSIEPHCPVTSKSARCVPADLRGPDWMAESQPVGCH